MGRLEMQVSAGIAGTDYAPAIQDAIDSLPSAGGTIELPPGTFEINSALVLRPGVRIRGSGINATTLRLKNAGQNGIEASAGSLTTGWIDIEDLTIDGNSITGVGHAISMANLTCCLVTRCQFNNFKTNSVIRWVWVEDSTISECIFFNLIGVGIDFISQSNNNRILDNTFTAQSGGIAVVLDNTTQNTVITGNNFEGATLGNLGVSCGGAMCTLISGNFFEEWTGACIAAVTGIGTNLTIDNNHLHARASAASYVNVHSSIGGPNDRVVITNNRFQYLGSASGAAVGVMAGAATNLVLIANLATHGGTVVNYNGVAQSTADFVLLASSSIAVSSLSAPKIATTVVPLTDAATIAVDAAAGGVQSVTLGGNRTVGAPSNPTSGQRLTFIVKQDGTGGRTLAWNPVFKQAWSNTGNTANKRSTISFAWDGANWNQDGAQSPYV